MFLGWTHSSRALAHNADNDGRPIHADINYSEIDIMTRFQIGWVTKASGRECRFANLAGIYRYLYPGSSIHY